MFKETVMTFHSMGNDKNKTLNYILFFDNPSDIENKGYLSGIIDNKHYTKADDLKEEILKNMPSFIKDMWYAIEVETPDFNMSGDLIGGYVVLHVLRQELVV